MRTILLVDDDESNLLLFKHMLAKMPYHTEMTSNARQCLDLAVGLNPALFVIDLRLPEVDGVTLATLIRAQPEWQDTPILIVTADKSLDAHQAAVMAGCNAVLTKPIDRTLLVSTVERLINTQAYA